jgi:HlyD family secretion protein
LVVLVAAVCLGWWLVQNRDAARRDTLSGIIETRDISLASKLPGRVSRAFVREGDAVRAGQPIVAFEDGDVRAVVASNEAAVQNALAKLDLLKAGTRAEQIARLQAAADEAKAVYEKARRGNRPQEIGEARAMRDQAAAELNKLLHGSRPEEIAQARALHEAAKADYDKAVAGPREEEISQARARLVSATSERELAERDLERMSDLFARNAVSRQQMDTATARYQTALAAEDAARQAYEQLHHGTRKEDIEAARQRMEQAKAQLALARKGPRGEDIQAARSRLQQAGAQLSLARSGARAEDIQAARERLDQAKAALAEATNGARPQDIEAARAMLRQARALLRQSRVNARETVLVAPAAGVVQKFDLRPGDFVPQGREVAVIQPANDLWVRVYVPEDRLGRLSVGKAVSVRVDSYPGEAFQGVVEAIGTEAEFTPRNVQTPEERVSKVFAVRVRLRDPRNRLRAGMSADIRLSEVAAR